MKKILVIQNKRIGDVLIASLIAANIKQIFPNSQVDYFVYDYTTGVIKNNPNIDKIIPIILMQSSWIYKFNAFNIKIK